ncbi:MAG: ExbD/TolR family protein [Planctomycetaceae bacterium]
MSRRRFHLADDDWGGGTKRSTGGDADLDITPMIDVTFLLLIFFMVASTMQKAPNMDVPAAKHGSSLDPSGAITFFITGDGSKETVPAITGERKDTYSIEQFASKVRAEAQGGKHTVIIQADGRVPSGFIDDVLRSIKDVPGVRYNVGVREKRQ